MVLAPPHPRSALASSPFPRAPGFRPFPQVLFGDGVRPESGSSWTRLPAAAEPRTAASRPEQGPGRGRPLGVWGCAGRRDRGSPAPVPSSGSGRLSSSASRLLPPSHGSSPKTETGALESVPSLELRPWDRRGRRGGNLGLGARPTGEAPALLLMFPPLSPPAAGSSGLGDPAAFARVPGPGLAAQQRPLAASPRHPGPGEGWSRHVLCS